MSNLKSRVMKLENVVNPRDCGGIIIYTDNEVREEGEVVSADYYLTNNNSVEPLTDEELAKALEGKTYITYLPVQDKLCDFQMVKVGR